MKRYILSIVLILSMVMLAGCNKNKEIVAEDVKANTVLIKNDGTVQAATIENFDKEYYNLEELTTYINEKVSEYNQKNGVDSVVLGELKLIDTNAVLIMNFKSLEHYNYFAETSAVVTSTTSAKNGEITLPDTFLSAKDGAAISAADALKNEKYKVLSIKENTEVLVDGTIKYYTNGRLNGKSKIQTSTEGDTIVVYKP
ncbi:hypothetical protein acsn021_07240 [Anaerocolumna cellulosilytica]|uniref:Uncharacterized protein n=1 Tax=Anaerocolumna cellulosilytica TaxID=433286 RepID=A0A6S6R0N3_9FIRM|nr:hypothetical protein [Anaerocolumna cellulosilytica]MBB5198014.1 threonyl-tRNA synthetase [Anaerocolumna cellulosilytica]BCJ93155.1 hypothetical protein acsn021_07240 [Anaerocolumna cellulosilytica]